MRCAPRPSEVCDRRLLWRFGISGDRPIVLVSAGVAAGLRPAALAGAGAAPLVLGRRRLRPGRRQRRAGVVPDGAAPGRSARCARRTSPPATPSPAPPRPASSSLRAERPAAPTSSRPCAPWRGCASTPTAGRSRTTCRSWSRSTTAPSRTGRRSRPRRCRPTWAPRSCRARRRASSRQTSGEFRFDVSALIAAGAALDQRARQSRLRRADHRGRRRLQLGPEQPPEQLTPWSNDPVGDPPGEWFLLQDTRTMQAWSVAPVGRRRQPAPSTGSRTARATASSATAAASSTSAPPGASTPTRRSSRCGCASSTAATGRCNLRVVGIAEWIIGANRADRGTTLTSAASQRAAPAEGDGAAAPRRAATSGA